MIGPSSVRPHATEDPALSHKAIKFRVHVLATVLLATFVMSLMAVFLLFALGRFGQVARDNAAAIFEHMADAQAQKLVALVGGARLVVETAAQQPARVYRELERPDAVLRSTLLAMVSANPSLYGAYVGLADGGFYQVIGLTGDPRAAATLGAPPGARFAVRVIASPSPRAEERWEFLDADAQRLGERRDPLRFDPTARPWYRIAPPEGTLGATAPYVFQSSGALGITLVRRLTRGSGVAAADLSLASLSAFMATTMANRPGGTLLLDGEDRILAMAGEPSAGNLDYAAPLSRLGTAGTPYLRALHAALDGRNGPEDGILDVDGEAHVLAVRPVEVAPGITYRFVSFAPMQVFAAPVLEVRDQVLLVSLAVLAFSLPLAYLVSRRASRALGQLAADSEKIRHMDFSGDPRVTSLFYEIDVLDEAHRTMKHSLRERTAALELARDKLSSLVESGLALSAVRDTESLLGSILLTGRRLANADAGTLYLVTEAGGLRFALRTRDDGLPVREIPLHDPASGAPNERYASVYAALRRETVVIDDIRRETRFDTSGTLSFDTETGYRTVSQVNVPLVASSGEVLGVLQLINAIDGRSGQPGPFDPEIVSFVEALAAQAAMAIDNHQLLEGQREMMDALIRIIAGAIDAKSAYTGGHCERVPELAVMLAEAACAVEEGPLAGFAFTDPDQWREFRIGAWLHDCGKVTTPEYVVDKATKLETLYNRIHEIRTRFEVLLRDARIRQLEAERDGADPAAAAAAYEVRRRQLLDDFAFLAECNIGGESMTDDALARLERIAGERWTRHFDDRLGLSQEEERRLAGHPAAPLPAEERLLADKAQHRVPRTEAVHFDPRLGIAMEVPELLYNLGELYNLRTRRGTLTREERFKINEHIIQTIVMLDRLPLPKNLRRVPEYAATHHETLDGSGYPRGLDAGQLSIPARIMAIADIFEALTASDRPYKRGLALSEAVAMLARFRDDGHIDPDLFALFLSAGIHRRYGERFLPASQIDEVRPADHLAH
ncbi:MAG: GAF domain-containing protein [Rhodocyclaceae bacterium]|nr:GAF domain-containing protein [Rhodocyclaceae bacterium]